MLQFEIGKLTDENARESVSNYLLIAALRQGHGRPARVVVACGGRQCVLCDMYVRPARLFCRMCMWRMAMSAMRYVCKA